MEAASICSDSSVLLTADDITGGTWSPSTGLTAVTGTTVSASPKNTTTYTVTGIKNGCPMSSFVTVNVSEECDPTFYIPNSFTPNADGRNDVFEVYGNLITNFQIKIFNRWGELFFESDDINRGWDGKYQNEDVQEDVYVYLITYAGTSSNNISLRGKVSVIR
jgi:gliding motility-associated-like protein